MIVLRKLSKNLAKKLKKWWRTLSLTVLKRKIEIFSKCHGRCDSYWVLCLNEQCIRFCLNVQCIRLSPYLSLGVFEFFSQLFRIASLSRFYFQAICQTQKRFWHKPKLSGNSGVCWKDKFIIWMTCLRCVGRSRWNEKMIKRKRFVCPTIRRKLN